MLREPAEPAQEDHVALPESDIDAALRTGDKDRALELLMDRYGDVVYRFALAMVRRGEVADEVRQRVFVEAYRDLDGFAGRSSLRTWLLGIARHRCLDETKKQRRWDVRFKNEPPGDENPEPPAPEQELDLVRITERLHDCLGKLAPAAREAVSLRYLQELSYAEISRIIGDVPGTLQQRVARALPELRRCLDAQLGHAPAARALRSGARGTDPAMSCERFWREGAVLAERGEPDPHRAGCEDCRHAHLGYLELVRALPLVDRGATGNAQWKLRVWHELARESRARRTRRVGAAVIAAAAAGFALWLVTRDGDGGSSVVDGERRPRMEIATRETMRSTSAHLGDRLRIFANRGEEVRFYQAGRLIHRCPVGVATIGCIPDDHGMLAETVLTAIDRYQVIVVRGTAPAWSDTIDDDRAALVASRVDYELFEVSAR
jgi:RNA polymerase sigma-70 factor, ECF subfamily